MNTFVIAMIRHQLAVLDAYLAALGKSGSGEAATNDAVKSWSAMMTPLLHAQCALWDQMIAAHREAIEQYRKQLRAELQKYEGKPGGKYK
jgi:hypothetical protein